MDNLNRFHTAGTYWLTRAENIALFFLCGILLVQHFATLNLWRGVIAFSLIDIVGYIPGAIAYRRQGGGRISPVYHHLYNIAHTYLVGGAGIAIWAWITGGFEWSMLAVPFHLSIDRGIFGNVLKPFALAFEPVAAAPEVVAAALGRNSLYPETGIRTHA